MKQEVILDFLNLPGIAGVALMGKRSRPYFCGIDQTLNFQQKEALTQGILQVFETIPDEFESFEFHFGGHQVYIYKLDHEIILLVLTQSSLVYSDYLKTIKSLKATLREDTANAIATFRLFAGAATLPGITTTQRTTSNQLTQSNQTLPGIKHLHPNHSPAEPVAVTPGAENLPLPSAVPPSVTNGVAPTSPQVAPSSLAEAIGAMNHLSIFTTQYLGVYVIANYWNTTRPDHSWLNQFRVDRAAQISVENATPQVLQTPLTPEQQTLLREWVARFIKRCTQVIRDFPTLIDKKGLDDAQRKLLLG